MTRVTIICPYYNRAHAVELTLRSIAAQDFADFEALIWDDCSIDGTWQELQRVANQIGDPRIKVFRLDRNLGLTQGLNHAIGLAKGEYVAVVGSGDECLPNRLSKQVAMLDSDLEASFCASGAIAVDEDTGELFRDEAFARTKIERRDIMEACPFTHGTVMYRMSALKAVGVYDSVFEWCADWDLFFRLLNFGYASYVAEPLYRRYARMDGVSFAPRKSIAQIKCKYLALMLSELNLPDRAEMIRRVNAYGLDSVVESKKHLIARDLRSRQVKILLLKRWEQAAELGRLIDVEFGTSLTWRLLLFAARVVSLMHINPDRAIEQARRFKSRFVGSGL